MRPYKKIYIEKRTLPSPPWRGVGGEENAHSVLPVRHSLAQFVPMVSTSMVACLIPFPAKVSLRLVLVCSILDKSSSTTCTVRAFSVVLIAQICKWWASWIFSCVFIISSIFFLILQFFLKVFIFFTFFVNFFKKAITNLSFQNSIYVRQLYILLPLKKNI